MDRLCIWRQGLRGWIFFGWNIEDSRNTARWEWCYISIAPVFPQKLVILERHQRAQEMRIASWPWTSPVQIASRLRKKPDRNCCGSRCFFRWKPWWFQVEIGPRSNRKVGDAILQPLEDDAMLALNYSMNQIMNVHTAINFSNFEWNL